MTTPSNEQSLEGLLERVKAATVPDRELDALLHAIVRDKRTVRENMHPEFGRQLLARNSRPPHDEYWLDHPATIFPAYTASIDATIALVERCLPGHWQRLLDKAMAEVVSRSFETDSDPKLNELPLAILAVLLTALSQEPSK